MKTTWWKGSQNIGNYSDFRSEANKWKCRCAFCNEMCSAMHKSFTGAVTLISFEMLSGWCNLSPTTTTIAIWRMRMYFHGICPATHYNIQQINSPNQLSKFQFWDVVTMCQCIVMPTHESFSKSCESVWVCLHCRLFGVRIFCIFNFSCFCIENLNAILEKRKEWRQRLRKTMFDSNGGGGGSGVGGSGHDNRQTNIRDVSADK